MRSHLPGPVILLFAVVPLLPFPAAEAQTADPPVTSCASFDLPLNHWGITAVRRLEALAIVAVQSTKRTISACTLATSLGVAAGSPNLRPGIADLVAGWQQRYEEEFGGEPPWKGSAGGDPGRFLVGGTVRTAQGRGAPGLGEFEPERTGTIPLPDGASLGVEVLAEGRISRRSIWFGAGASGDSAGLSVGRLEITAATGPLSLTVGRGSVGYGYGGAGVIVLHGATGLDRVDLSTSRPFSLPLVGTVSVGGFVGRVDDARHLDDPFILGMTGSIRPLPRLTLAVNRAAMFSGDGESIGTDRIFSMLIGRVAGKGFENQIVSVEALVRMPTERFAPVTVYVEWGAEDAAGAWWDVPARIVGLYMPAIPGLTPLAVGVEHASFAPSCCSNPEWYRHWSFNGSWALDERPLGHPLGGHGSELSAYLEAELVGGRLTSSAVAFTRDRHAENLFVPGREGRSVGTRGELRWRPTRNLDLIGSGAFENGIEWRETLFSIGAHLIL